ncbi:glycosyltransferase family 4 protein [Flavobacterium sp. CFS9]|uniref:Glycosyltransferase family 4 protein n=2 Tax=Flavobacterium sp. CFS9 TaxID=3143118 RepID=A0AAT9GYH4_9FLAO
MPQLKLIDSKIEIDIYYFDEEIALTFEEKTTRLGFFELLPVNDYDIIHSSGLRPNIYTYLHGRKFNNKTKLITTIHSFIYKDFRNQFNAVFASIFSKIWYLVLNSQNTVVVLTDIAKQYYSNKIKTRVEVVNNGRKKIQTNSISDIDKELMMEIRGKFSFVMGTHAVVSKIKGLDTVIKGLQTLKDFCFIIIGDGPEVENLKLLARELNVHNQVFFLGFKKNIGSFFQFYDVYVMPSRSEGLPIALIEAISCKTLCLTSNIPTFNELFTDEEVPKFILDDTNDFCKEILKLKESDRRENFIENAYYKYHQKYSDEIMAKNYYSLYKKLL